MKPVEMAGDCTHSSYAKPETFWSDDVGLGGGETKKVEDSKGRGNFKPWPPRFEVRNGLLYRKKLERGFVHYREVLDEDRRHEAIGTIHRQQRSDQHHLSLEETYKCVAENYWWEGMAAPSPGRFDLIPSVRRSNPVQKTSIHRLIIVPESCIHGLCV